MKPDTWAWSFCTFSVKEKFMMFRPDAEFRSDGR
jgi:hypothetical protein